ncbi:MAG TPA: STAS domain-containing protein [Gemmatimonadales bacterium]|nr:STAS domain-containing protein [Gemmatimonadales bacterium]
MKISAVRGGGSALVTLEGRLDREWAEQLSGTLERLVQQGVRSLRLDFSQVTYISSAGMQVLGRWHLELASLRGEVRMESIPAAVQQAFDSAGWRPPERGGTGGQVLTPHEHRKSSWHSQSDLSACGSYEHATINPEGKLTCRLHGNPDRLTAQGIGPADVSTVAFPEGAFGLGLGAIGKTWEDASSRIGELIAVNGSIAVFPTDGARTPDYFAQGEQHGAPPEAVFATGLSCTGSFSHLVRFSPRPDAEAIPLSELASVALDATGGRMAGVVIAAECAGATGVRIRRSPGAGKALSYDLPAVRDWLLFSPDRIHVTTTAIVAGVVARSPKGPLAAHLRPLAPTGRLMGHLHAAVFSYHPLPQRTVELTALLGTLFGTRNLRDVLHLLSDDRSDSGVPESEFMRGVAWAGPIHEVV